MTTNTIHLQRVLRAPPERVFRAFTTPAALCKWLPPHGFTCEVQAMDVRVGGHHHASFTNFSAGGTHGFGGSYLEVVPGERLRYTTAFDPPFPPGEMTTTIVLAAVVCGTAVQVEQSGIPAEIPPEMCHLGWQESLALLALLVEPDIPGG